MLLVAAAACMAFASPADASAHFIALSYHAKYEATLLWCALLVIPGTVVAFTLYEVDRQRGRVKPPFRTRLDPQARRRASLALADVRAGARRARELMKSDDDVSPAQLASRRRLIDIATAAEILGDPWGTGDGRKITALVVFGRLAEFHAAALESDGAHHDVPRACFFDPMHHVAYSDWAWRADTPESVRVPVCSECARALGSDDRPRSLGVRRGRKVVPYWTVRDGVFTKTGFGAFGDLVDAVSTADELRAADKPDKTNFRLRRRSHSRPGRKGHRLLPIGVALLAGAIGAFVTVGTKPLTGSAHGHVLLFGVPGYGVFIGLLVGLVLGGLGCLPILLCLLIVRTVKKTVDSVRSHERG